MNNHARSRQNRENLAAKNQIVSKHRRKDFVEARQPLIDDGVLVFDEKQLSTPAAWRYIPKGAPYRRKFRKMYDNVIDILKKQIKKAS